MNTRPQDGPLSLLSRQRALAQQAIHEYFAKHDFLPVDVPILVTSPGTEVHLQYFKTQWKDHHGSEHQYYLRSSPELHLKQALAEGLERIYHLGKAFRNAGELSTWHHPEFTMLEWYQAGISFSAFMDQTFELISCIQEKLASVYPKQSLNRLSQARKISVYDAFLDFAKITLIDGDPDLAMKARALAYHSVRPEDDFETSYFKILIDVIEPQLAKLGTVFLYDYPPSQAALARIEDGRAQRFELYLDGIEICNAFSELIDVQENIRRLKQSNMLRSELGYELIPIDEDFISALHQGLPACCGNALGFDRLLAYLLNLTSIDSIVPFRRQYFARQNGK